MKSKIDTKSLIELCCEDVENSLVISVSTVETIVNSHRVINGYDIFTYHKGITKDFYINYNKKMDLQSFFYHVSSNLKIRASKEQIKTYILSCDILSIISSFNDFQNIRKYVVQSGGVFSIKPLRLTLKKKSGAHITFNTSFIDLRNYYRKNTLDDLANDLNVSSSLSKSNLCMEWYLRYFKDKIIPSGISKLSEKYAFSKLEDLGYKVEDITGLKQEVAKGEGGGKPFDKPISPFSAEINTLASNCYRGAINIATQVGFFNNTTYDYDLISAYPIAIASIPMVDFSQKLPKKSYTNRKLNEEIISNNPFMESIGFGRVDFSFPKDTKFPCISVPAGEAGIINPLQANDIYATWQEVYQAFKMGAEITLIEFKFLKTLDEYPFRDIITPLLNLKLQNNNILIKDLINSFYGKLSQGITKTAYRDFKTNEMVEKYPSSITAPVYAATATALVRLMLVDVYNKLENSGYNVYSITTDGFITDAKPSVVKTLNTSDISDVFSNISSSINLSSPWKTKHAQKYLLNITTRTNQGIEALDEFTPVSAKISYKGTSEMFIKDYSQRTRKGVLSEQMTLPTLNELSSSKTEYIPFLKKKTIKYNPDFKREIILETLRDCEYTFDGGNYKTFTFKTKPYDSFTDFQNIRNKIEKNNISFLSSDDILNFVSDNDDITKDFDGAFSLIKHCKPFNKNFVRFKNKKIVEMLQNIAKEKFNFEYTITRDRVKNLSRKERYKKDVISKFSYDIVQILLEYIKIDNNL